MFWAEIWFLEGAIDGRRGSYNKKIKSTDHVIDIESFCLPPAHLKLKSRVFSNSFSSFLLLKQRWVLKCELKKDYDP